MNEVVIAKPPAPIHRPRFFCTDGHGATNNILRLNQAVYCTDCLAEVAGATLAEAIRMADFGA